MDLEGLKGLKGLKGLRRLPATIRDNIVGRPVDVEGTLRQFGVNTPLDPNATSEAIPSLTAREVAYALHFHAKVTERGESYSNWEVEVPNRLGIVPELFGRSNWTTYKVVARYKEGAYQETLMILTSGKPGKPESDLEVGQSKETRFNIRRPEGLYRNIVAEDIRAAEGIAAVMARGATHAALSRPTPSVPEDPNTAKIISISRNNPKDTDNDQPDDTKGSKYGN